MSSSKPDGAGVGIGLLDTGVDGGHPGLAGRIEQFIRFEPGGFGAEAVAPTDPFRHGTHSAGLLAAAAPGARLHVGAVIEEGNILARMLLGLDWLAESGALVVCLPIGVRGQTPVFHSLLRALAARDVLVVAAIGNGGAGIGHTPGLADEVLSVGATGGDGRVARFSGSVHGGADVGCLKPDVVAPGVDMASLAPGGGMALMSGTSAATATVAGIAAVLRQAFPGASAIQVRRAITSSSAALPDGQAHRARYGSVRLSAALEALSTVADQAEPSWPDATGQRFRDARLQAQLARVGDASIVDAILEADDAAAFDDLRNTLSGDHRVTFLLHAPIAIVRARAGCIRALLERSWLRCASACDVNRAACFG